MTDTRQRPSPKSRADYLMFVKFATRWRDNDQYGHMNNAVYYELFDSAINKFLIDAEILDTAGGNSVFLVASSGCDYFTEVAYPSDVEVGLAINRLGGSAITYDLGLFVAGAELTAATGFVVHVNVGGPDMRPTLMDDITRAKCASLVRD
jgi:acyl-CoA thioester hydrolase